jgi:hypothetical protein
MTSNEFIMSRPRRGITEVTLTISLWEWAMRKARPLLRTSSSSGRDWMVVLGVYNRQFVAFLLFAVSRRTFTARCPDALDRGGLGQVS